MVAKYQVIKEWCIWLSVWIKLIRYLNYQLIQEFKADKKEFLLHQLRILRGFIHVYGHYFYAFLFYCIFRYVLLVSGFI